MKILFVSPNLVYINPTQSLLPIALGMKADIFCYGNGYVSDELLEQGIDRFVDAIGGVDLIVSSLYFAKDYTAERINAGLKNYAGYSKRFSVSDKVLADIKGYLRRNRTRVVVSFLDSDIFASSQQNLDSISAHGKYYLGPGTGSFSLKGASAEKYVHTKLKKGDVLGLYDNFAEDNKQYIINLQHIVADNEFFWQQLFLRPYDLTIPGSAYYRRAELYKFVKSISGVRVARKSYEYLYKAADRLGLRPYANYYLVKLYNMAFQQRLVNSKMCVTDGGLIAFTVRKYFEIPATGALMACWKTSNSAELGFEDGISCLELDSFSQVRDYAMDVSKHPEKYQDIATAGQRMVMNSHSLTARSDQIYQSLQRIKQETFSGSSWVTGKFHLLEPSKSE